MTFNVSTDTPTSPPTSGGKLFGTGAGPTYAPDTFNIADFLTRDTDAFVSAPSLHKAATSVVYTGKTTGTSGSVSGACYFGIQNELGTPLSHVGMSVNTDGSSNISFMLTDAGSRSSDRRALIFGMGSGAVYPGSDAVVTLGAGPLRWGVVFSGTGTINTSDQREKNWLGGLADNPLREAYLAAARDIEDALGHYQWLDAVEAKGEDARWHFGAQAQVVIGIFMAHGLEDEQGIDLPAGAFIPEHERPRFRHAFLCFDTWEEERASIMKAVKRTVSDADGVREIEEQVPTGETRQVVPPGNRFGFRTDQLLAFLAAANAIMRRDLEARVTAIEAALAG